MSIKNIIEFCEKHEGFGIVVAIVSGIAALALVILAIAFCICASRASAVQTLAASRGIHLTWWQAVQVSPAEVSYFPNPTTIKVEATTGVSQ